MKYRQVFIKNVVSSDGKIIGEAKSVTTVSFNNQNVSASVSLTSSSTNK